MYMALDRPSTPLIDHEIALHKMVRLITMGLGEALYEMLLMFVLLLVFIRVRILGFMSIQLNSLNLAKKIRP